MFEFLASSLLHLGGIKGLIGGFEPVEQGLPGGKPKRTHCHPQSISGDDFLKLLGYRFQ
jgi:hypothetical protein